MGLRVSDGLLPDPGKQAKNVVIWQNGKIPRDRRRVYLRLPFACKGYAPICCDSNDPKTQIAGIIKRMGRELPPLDLAEVAKFKQFVNQWLLRNLTPLDTVLTFEEWLESTSYTLSRKNELRRELAKCNGKPTKKQCRSIASFMKTESYDEFKLPRGINSRHDAFKAYSGPFFKSIEKEVYNLPQFVKHIPVADRPKYIKDYLVAAHAQYMVTDYTSFEASFTPEVMDACECQLYNYMLSKFPEDAKLIVDTIKGQNHGSMHCGVSYKLKGRRMSGDMCTSLGNGFTNLMIFEFLMQGREARILVEGDDGLAAIYDQNPLPTKEQYEKLGFVIKIEKVDDPMLASFCGCICPGGVIVRDPRSVLSTFAWTSTNVNAAYKMQMQLLRAKALSLAYEMPHCPILRAMADRALVLTRGFSPRFVADGYHDISCIPKDEKGLVASAVPLEARQFYSDRYNIDPTVQLIVEKRIRSSSDLDWLFQYIPPLIHTQQYEQNFIEVG